MILYSETEKQNLLSFQTYLSFEQKNAIYNVCHFTMEVNVLTVSIFQYV